MDFFKEDTEAFGMSVMDFHQTQKAQKTVNCRNDPSPNPIQLSKGNIVLDARASTMHTFLLEVHVIPLLS
jgi:hypothetical protein